MAERPEILLLSLAYRGFFDEIYWSLIDQLFVRSILRRPQTADTAVRYLKSHRPKAIIVSDEGLTQSENRAALEKVRAYLEGGGTVILGLHFPSFMPLDVFSDFFEYNFNLPWQAGDYHRTTFTLKRTCALPPGVENDAFPARYSINALHIRGALPHEIIMGPAADAQLESRVFPAYDLDHTQGAVVGTRIGDGYLAYVGDVNPEEGTDQVILALCGLVG